MDLKVLFMRETLNKKDEVAEITEQTKKDSILPICW